MSVMSGCPSSLAIENHQLKLARSIVTQWRQGDNLPEPIYVQMLLFACRNSLS
jgi:hypothetical protein